MCEHSETVVLKAHRLGELAAAKLRTGYDRFGDINKQKRRRRKS